jgi:hypothetical protein
MQLLSRFALSALAVSLFAVPSTLTAQRSDDNRRVPEVLQHRGGDWDDDRWDDDDDDRRRSRAHKGKRRGQDDEWLRRQRAQREEWCRRNRNDRRCDDLYRRDNRRDNRGAENRSWCWDRNRDGRCDNFDRRRDSRSGVLRDGRDRGPEWERWLRANGVDLSAFLTPR